MDTPVAGVEVQLHQRQLAQQLEVAVLDATSKLQGDFVNELGPPGGQLGQLLQHLLGGCMVAQVQGPPHLWITCQAPPSLDSGCLSSAMVALMAGSRLRVDDVAEE